jgi:hypothetical protein
MLNYKYYDILRSEKKKPEAVKIASPNEHCCERDALRRAPARSGDGGTGSAIRPGFSRWEGARDPVALRHHGFTLRVIRPPKTRAVERHTSHIVHPIMTLSQCHS